MSDWDRQYHRKRLEEATGERWFPSSAGMTRCSHDLARANRMLASVRSIERLVKMTQLLCVGLIGAGIAVGAMGIYTTIGPTVALILPSAICFLAGIGVRIPLNVYLIDRYELEVVDRQEAYDVAVQKEIAS